LPFRYYSGFRRMMTIETRESLAVSSSSESSAF
jgi:hypothetical protein